MGTILFCTSAQAQTWEPVTDTGALSALFRDTVIEATLKDGVKATATYRRDGTGEIRAWGDTFQRTWEVNDKGQVCIGLDEQINCYRLERDTETQNQYRATNLNTGEVFVLTIDQTDAGSVAVESPTTSSGGAAKPSAEEIAAKLANPNTPLASMTFKLQYRTFDGDLPDAGDQDSTTLLFQPSFPFKLENGDVIFFRPAFPFLLDQPVVNVDASGFDSESGLGDIAFDLAYGRTTKAGILWAGGIVSTLPTATEDALGTDSLTLGPEFLIGKLTKKYVIGAFPSHQWDVGGSGNADINVTSLQLFYTYLPGGGWNVGTLPIMSYDHESDESTIPLNFQLGKTVVWKGRPWKLSAELNYYVDQPDAFGPEWFIGFNAAPVVENVFASWFK